jgi:hypothetical protein
VQTLQSLLLRAVGQGEKVLQSIGLGEVTPPTSRQLRFWR